MRDALDKIIGETADREVLHRAITVLVERLGWHPAQQTQGGWYTELSISYLSKAAECAIGTAHTAWHIVRGVLQWQSIPIGEVRSRQLLLRRRGVGQRWGQHLVLSDDARRACAATVQRRGAPEVEHEWREVDVVRRRAARCPWHDDRNPSAIWNIDHGGQTACLVCMCCKDSQGRALVALAERTATGRWRARLSARTLGLQVGRGRPVSETLLATPPPSTGGKPSTPTTTEESAKQRTPLDLPETSRRGEVVLGRLSRRGMDRRASGADDLISVLRSADARSGDMDWGSAILAADTDQGDHHHPDRLVSVQRLRPIEWRRAGSSARPSRWRPIEQRWVLVDLDGLSSPLRDRNDVASFVARVQELADTDAWLDGSFAVVRTSEEGVQIWLRLVCSVNPERFAAARTARAWQAGLGAALADHLESAGLGRPKVDLSATGSHRYGRRPGWRVKDGQAVRACLLASKEAA